MKIYKESIVQEADPCFSKSLGQSGPVPVLCYTTLMVTVHCKQNSLISLMVNGCSQCLCKDDCWSTNIWGLKLTKITFV